MRRVPLLPNTPIISSARWTGRRALARRGPGGAAAVAAVALGIASVVGRVFRAATAARYQARAGAAPRDARDRRTAQHSRRRQQSPSSPIGECGPVTCSRRAAPSAAMSPSWRGRKSASVCAARRIEPAFWQTNCQDKAVPSARWNVRSRANAPKRFRSPLEKMFDSCATRNILCALPVDRDYAGERP